MAVRKGKTQTDYLAEDNRDLFWTSMFSTAEQIGPDDLAEFSEAISKLHGLEQDYTYGDIANGPLVSREAKRYGYRPVWRTPTGPPTGRYIPKNGGYGGAKRGSTRKMCSR